MLIPLTTESPLRRTPYANYALVAANILLFAAQAAQPKLVDLLHLPGQLPQWWQFLTYQFLHAGIMHLIGNMIFLYVFGNNVNDKMGNTLYVLFYLLGGVAAGAAHVLTDVHPVIGASGSVAAVTGAFLVFFPQVRVTILWLFILITTFQVPAMYLVILFFAKDVLMNVSGGGGNTAHMAHIGGTVFGFAVCFTLLALKLVKRNPFDLFAMAQRANRKRQYRDVVSAGYDPYGFGGGKVARPARAPQNTPKHPHEDRIHDLRAQMSNALSTRDMDTAARTYADLKSLDTAHVLSVQQQEDIANELFSRGQYSAAAEAYETFLKNYSRNSDREQIGRVYLMLGLIYGRYLNRTTRAVEMLDLSLPNLRSDRDLNLAQQERQRLGGSAPPPLPTA